MPPLPSLSLSDPGAAALSVAVAVFASLAAIEIGGRIRWSRGTRRLLWLLGASLVVGGGIWASHTLALLARGLSESAVRDPWLSGPALLLAVTGCGLGLAVMLWGRTAGPQVVGCLLAGLAILAAQRLVAGAEASGLDGRAGIPLALFAAAGAAAALRLSLSEVAGLRRLAQCVAVAAAIAAVPLVGLLSLGLQEAGSAVRPDVALPAWLIAAGSLPLLAFGFLSALIDRHFARLAARETRALRISERRLRALVENSSDIILLLDPDLSIRFGAACPLIGEPRDLEGWSLLDLLPQEERAAVAEAARNLLSGTEGGATGELSVMAPDGGLRRFDYVLRDLSSDPAVSGLVITLHDITARKLAEEEMSKARDLAEAASEAKTQFIANMSHELRTPLNAIIGFSQLIRDQALGPLGNERYAEYIVDINDSGERLLGVLTRILDLARLQMDEVSLREDALDLAVLVEETASRFEERLSAAGLALDRKAVGSLALRGDRQRLAQLLGELLDNAVRFTPEGGVIMLATEAGEEGAVLSVVDSGIGIGAADIERVREPFAQADGSLARKYEGAGLGLPIAIALAVLHGARLELDSELGAGTAVRIVFPAERILTAAPAAGRNTA